MPSLECLPDVGGEDVGGVDQRFLCAFQVGRAQPPADLHEWIGRAHRKDHQIREKQSGAELHRSSRREYPLPRWVTIGSRSGRTARSFARMFLMCASTVRSRLVSGCSQTRFISCSRENTWPLRSINRRRISYSYFDSSSAVPKNAIARFDGLTAKASSELLPAAD